jgi:hypothetical protein
VPPEEIGRFSPFPSLCHADFFPPAFVKPYIFSTFPAGTVPIQSPEQSSTSGVQAQPSFNTTTVVQVRSSLSLQISQTMSFPFNRPEPNAAQNASIRLMTFSSSAQCQLYMMTTPTDKTAASIEGSSIWCFSMRPWPEQIDELVTAGQYSDALALLETVDDTLLPDKVGATFSRNYCIH